MTRYAAVLTTKPGNPMEAESTGRSSIMGPRRPEREMMCSVGDISLERATRTGSYIYPSWSECNLSGAPVVRPNLENTRSERGDIGDSGGQIAQHLPPPASFLRSARHSSSVARPMTPPVSSVGEFARDQQQDTGVWGYLPYRGPGYENNEDRTRSVHRVANGLEHFVNQYRQGTSMIYPATSALGSALSAPPPADTGSTGAATHGFTCTDKSASTSVENIPSDSMALDDDNAWR